MPATAKFKHVPIMQLSGSFELPETGKGAFAQAEAVMGAKDRVAAAQTKLREIFGDTFKLEATKLATEKRPLDPPANGPPAGDPAPAAAARGKGSAGAAAGASA